MSSGRILSSPFFLVFMNLQESIERTVTGLGYDLVDVERSARGLLRVSIDRVPGHAYSEALGLGEFVTIDDCEAVSRQLQYSLEVDGIAYERLEVASPGLDRPLKRPADFERFCGQAVDVTLKVAFQGRKHWRGTLMAAPDVSPATATSAWKLALEAEFAGQELTFHVDEVREARLVPVIDFKGRRKTAPAKG
jgi:ribosome maturation factor RimP